MLSKEEMQEKVAVRTEETLALLNVLISKKVKQYLDMDLQLGLSDDEHAWWLFKAAFYSVQRENSHLFNAATNADQKEFRRLHQVTPSVSA